MPLIPFQKIHRYAIPTYYTPETRGALGKKIWIIIDVREDDEQHRTLLGKILMAVGKSLDEDTCTLIYDNKPFQLSALASSHHPQIVLCFGIAPSEIGLNIVDTKYQRMTLGETVYLFADAMSKITADQSAKKNLWSVLQKLF